MSEHVQHGYGTVDTSDDDYEGRVMAETWSAPKGTVLLELWGMSGDRTGDLDSYLYFSAEEARHLGVALIEMSRSARMTESYARLTDDDHWSNESKREREEPLVDGANEYAEEAKQRVREQEAAVTLGLAGLEHDDVEMGVEFTDEIKARFEEVLKDEFGYRDWEFEPVSKTNLEEAFELENGSTIEYNDTDSDGRDDQPFGLTDD